MFSIKVCGMTDLTNINKILRIGVDALGFILAESPRQITIKKSKKIIKKLPPFISTVAVTVNPTVKQIQNIIQAKVFDYIQFHGEEKPELIKNSPLKNIKTIKISCMSDLNQIHNYDKFSFIDYFLFDNKTENRNGGTGETFSWDILDNISINKPFILAGGLGVTNIKKAIEKVKPDAIDLNSCIEKKPGIKDVNLYKQVISEIKQL